VALDVDDVDRDAGQIVVTEKKKRGNRRRMPLPSYVLDAHTSNSLGTYIDHQRDTVDPDTDAVFVTGSAERWISRRRPPMSSRLETRPAGSEDRRNCAVFGDAGRALCS